MNTFLYADKKYSDGALRSLRYLNLFYFLSVALFTFFILKINLQFGSYQYNKYFLPLFGLFLLMPVLVRVSSNLLLCTYVFLGLASCLTFALVACSGGFFSIGIIWLSVFPLVGGVLIGKKGIITGVLLVFISLFGFYMLGLTNDHSTVLSELMHKNNSFAYESAIDLAAFSVFNIAVAYFFITSELKLNTELAQQKNSTESLLRVVLHDIAAQVSTICFAQKQLSKIGANEMGASEPEAQGNSSKYLSRLKNATHEMIALLDVVRKMSVLKDGKEELNSTSVDSVALVQEVVSLLAFSAEQKNILININGPQGELRINVNPTIFKNIIVANIISNAIKFSNEGSKIDILIYKKGRDIRVEIQDYGVGMSPVILDQLFNIQSKYSRVGTNGEPGTGYGMPLAKEYVEKMGGQIFIYSSEQESLARPRGSLLILQFPAI